MQECGCVHETLKQNWTGLVQTDSRHKSQESQEMKISFTIEQNQTKADKSIVWFLESREEQPAAQLACWLTFE